MNDYDHTIVFKFMKKRKVSFFKSIESCDINEWINIVDNIGLDTIQIISFYDEKNMLLLGFANTSRTIIKCFWKDGTVTYFQGKSVSDSIVKKWNTTFTEYLWKNDSLEKPRYENNKESLRKVLKEISDFSKDLDGHFYKVFDNAISCLDGEQVELWFKELEVPDDNKILFNAAGSADVFAGMGSWNDTPRCLAMEQNKYDEYNSISQDLFKQIRLAIMYAVNEW